jgi:hypothetical protein
VRASVIEVQISKSDNLGESDLIALFQKENGERFALYIEDKINAPLQPQQAERYRMRAEHGLSNGLFSSYETVLCAPEVYLAAAPESELFDSRISYEAIGTFIRSSHPDGPRSAYRARLIESSIPKSATVWEREDDPATNAFWDAAYEIAHNEFREIEMKPLRMTKGSTWVTFRPSFMPTLPQPKYVAFKGGWGFMDLTFGNARDYLFAPKVQELLESGMDIVQTGKSVAIRLKVKPIEVCEVDDSARQKLRSAFAACVRLIRFYRQHQQVLDAAAAESRPTG